VHDVFLAGNVTFAWIAPYEGIVLKVLLASGMAAGQPETIVIEQLNPIGVEVVMPRKEAEKINSTVGVTVYPSIDSNPVGIMYNSSVLTDKGIIFFIENRPLLGNYFNKDGKKIPVARGVKNVLLFHFRKESEVLSVPVNSIFEDEKGYYVWLAVGQMNMQPGKALDKIFTVKKEYIVPDNKKRCMMGFITYRALLNPGSLKEYNMVLTNPPKHLKENDLVYYHRQRYVFMPGDTVKVEIGN